MKVWEPIFNRKLLEYELNKFKDEEIDDLREKLNIIDRWKYSIDNSDLNKTKEKQLQGKFLLDFFVDILGYKDQIGRSNWNFIQEEKTKVDGTKPDGVLGFFSNSYKDIRVVIELKDAKTNLDDKQISRKNRVSPVEQAFSYAPKYGDKCKWVIVSNFKEIRLYRASDSSKYEKFEVTNLTDKSEFLRFYYILNYKNLINPSINSLTDDLYINNKEQNKKITDNFYKEYKKIRLNLLDGLKSNNSNVEELILIEKAQKLMDRFIFICFCESKRLLPQGTFKNVLNVAQNSYEPIKTKIWMQLKGLFHAIDKGNPPMNINRFNGGLFAEDNELDNLFIPDDMFIGLEELSKYDFDIDLNVNILGHIFEQSISDIEEIKAEVQGIEVNKNDSKRKKNGIFYTPEYITHYIVSECIGSWLEDRRKDLGEDNLNEIPEFNSKMTKEEKSARTREINKHKKFWKQYAKVLSNIKVIDPACGSGAFLNAAFDYLYNEGQRVNNEIAKLDNGQYCLFDLDKNILKNNLYGVDLNKESVEITKLSLWLKTANKKDKLTSLDNNILCGNSIIDDKQYDSSNAFNWNDGFKEIMSKGGFDIVIGNPPYVRQEIIAPYKEYLKNKYSSYSGRADLYVYFIEKGLNLLNSKGKLGYICSNKYTKVAYGKKLRKVILNSSKIIEFVDFGDLEVFKNVIAYPSIILLQKNGISFERSDNKIRYCGVKSLNINLNTYVKNNTKLYKQQDFDENEWIFEDYNYNNLNKELSCNFDDFEHVIGYPKSGVKTGKNPAYVLSKEKADEFIKIDPKNVDIIKPYIRGENVKPFYVQKNNFIIFPYKKVNGKLELVDLQEYPIVYNYLLNMKEDLEKRAIIKDGIVKGTKVWYEYQQINKDFDLDKTYLVYPDIAKKNSFAISKGNVIDMTVFFVENHNALEYLALLNSSTLEFIFKGIAVDCRGGYKRYKTQYVRKLPIPELKGSNLIESGEVVNNIIKDIYELKIKKTNFINFLKKVYLLKKETKEIEMFNKKGFDNLINELKKQKIKLDATQSFDLMKVFDKETSEINKLISHLNIQKNRSEIFAHSAFYDFNDNDRMEHETV